MFLHRMTVAVAAAGFAVILAGSSTGSVILALGWVGGVLADHRFAAALLGILTVLLALAFTYFEPRRPVQALALVALAVILAQGMLGRFNVIRGLPAVLSTAHAGLAQIYFAILVSLGILTSRGWRRGYDPAGLRSVSAQALADDGTLRRLAVLSIALVYLQIALGAVVRHTGAGHAIPDYPLMFGRLAPPLDSFATGAVAVHFVHRLGAIATSIVLAATAWRVLSRHKERRELVNAAILALALLALEIVLGASAVFLDSPAVLIAQVAAGAVLLATTAVLGLRAHRPFFGKPAVAAARG
jgi:heme a synthase